MRFQTRSQTRPLLSLRGLCKRYAAPVLIGVDFDVLPGQVHALVGANGAGKSTLAGIVCGVVAPTAGAMTLGDRPYRPRSKSDAERAAVRMVMQELNLVGTLSVAENLFLARMPSRMGFVSYRRMHAEARRALAAVGLDELDPETPVDQLGVGRQQLVEIAAALARRCRLLILDEPTAALTDPQIDLLFTHIRRLKRRGVGVIYISHRLEEIRQIADRVTVLRDGVVVDSAPAAEISPDRIVRRMVGGQTVHEIDSLPRSIGDVAMRVEGLCRGKLVRNVSFDVRRGEILGLAGLVGSGRTETLRAIFGADRPDAGRVTLGDAPNPVRIRQPCDAVGAGIGMIPEDRKQHGLLLPQPVRVNTTLATLRESAGRLESYVAGCAHGARMFVGPACRAGPEVPLGKRHLLLLRLCAALGWIDARGERDTADRLRTALEIGSTSAEQPVVELSGGNQQKVVMARWLLRDCDVFLFDEPTRGIDVKAKGAVYRLLGRLASRGKALVVVSSDLRELMAVCDRIVVMSAGKVAGTFRRGEWTEELIMAAAISGYVQGADEK